MNSRTDERGFALLAVMVLAAFLIAVLAVYFFLAGVSRSAAKSTMDAWTS